MAENNGGPAYPTPYLTRDGDVFATNYADGMSLRQWYAGKAMQFFVTQSDPEECARLSFEYADAMLAHEAKEAT